MVVCNLLVCICMGVCNVLVYVGVEFLMCAGVCVCVCVCVCVIYWFVYLWVCVMCWCMCGVCNVWVYVCVVF